MYSVDNRNDLGGVELAPKRAIWGGRQGPAIQPLLRTTPHLSAGPLAHHASLRFVDLIRKGGVRLGPGPLTQAAKWMCKSHMRG